MLIIKKKLIEQDKTEHMDRRTIHEVAKVDSFIHPSIQATYDCPSKHPEGRMPLLDLEVWVDDDKEVVFSFFEKPITIRPSY